MRLQNICKILIGIFSILTLVSCAENPNSATIKKTPYESFTQVIKALGGGQRGSKINRDRSPLINPGIYAREGRDKLIYFYQGKDSHNINFSRILKEYADKAWLQVEAYTLDNHSLMEFPDSRLATVDIIAKYFGNEATGFKTPVLFLEQDGAYAIPVSVGEISLMQLVNKMNTITERRQKQ
jgi:hypothetical protein